MPTTTLTVSSTQFTYIFAHVTYRGVYRVLHKMRSEKHAVHGNISSYYPTLQKERKNHKQQIFFQDIQMHKWNQESHENSILMTIFFSAFSYFENHRLKYSQRFFIIFLTLLGSSHSSMFKQVMTDHFLIQVYRLILCTPLCIS